VAKQHTEQLYWRNSLQEGSLGKTIHTQWTKMSLY